ncbi:PiggyBac transposable element-derived protein 1 [Trichinella nativa]|uniref:PiggyBac transposable element-derived protein 1 n=1 Tax=Trichinella nativa TaxID=6335 RepID=A0A0V1KPI8_9BILA|nr:PiggyBac transposable element-derived protein 1 [Trichinella nativa]
MQVRNKRVCHDFWLCDVMDLKVESPVGFFSVNVVIKLCKTLPKDKGDGIQSVATKRSNRLRSYPVMAFNELKRRRRGANDFYRTNDNKVCVVKWFDDSEVILSSTYKCVNPLDGVREGNDKKFIDVPCPSIVKEYKQFMGGVNLTGMLISLYIIGHNSRKWHR